MMANLEAEQIKGGEEHRPQRSWLPRGVSVPLAEREQVPGREALGVLKMDERVVERHRRMAASLEHPGKSRKRPDQP